MPGTKPCPVTTAHAVALDELMAVTAGVELLLVPLSGAASTVFSPTRVNAATVRIEAADHHVICTDKRGQYAHGRDQPERGISRDGKCEANYVGFAGAPVAVENRRRALPIHVARSLNVCRNH